MIRLTSYPSRSPELGYNLAWPAQPQATFLLMDGAWILLGMMGAGKSTVGRALADALMVPFKDTDSILQYKLGRPIQQLFSLYGESTFRQHETAILKGLDREPCVLATGGGIILADENWTEFSRLGTTIFLDIRPEKLIERLQLSKRKRPLLQTEAWEEKFMEIYHARYPIYCRADIHYRLDPGGLEEAVEALEGLVKGQ